MNIRQFITLCLLLTASLALISCATGSQPAVSRGPDIEGMLLEAGFARNPIDSPEKMERAQVEVQRKVIPYEDLGQIYYVYVDVDLCQCLYVAHQIFLVDLGRHIVDATCSIFVQILPTRM